jgi:hypothetical protein
MEFRWSSLPMGDHGVGDLVGRGVPLIGDRQVALLLRDQAVLVLLLQVRRPLLVLGEDLAAWSAARHVVLGDRDAGLRREAEAEVLERVEHLGDGAEAPNGLAQRVHERGRVALRRDLLMNCTASGSKSSPIASSRRALDAVVEDDAPDVVASGPPSAHSAR